MKLIPKTKPVRFSIKSGNEDCASLQALCESFNIHDVEILMDGRFIRWLKLIGERELAETISRSQLIEPADTEEAQTSVRFSKDGILTLLNICFGKDWTCLFDAYYDLSTLGWWKSDDFPYVETAFSGKSVASLLRLYSEVKGKGLSTLLPMFHSELIKHLETDLGEGIESSLFTLGLALIDSSDKDIAKKGVECIKRAKILGDTEAIEWFESSEYAKKHRLGKRAGEIVSDLKPYQLDYAMRSSLQSRLRSISSNWSVEIARLSPEEKAIYNFHKTCLEARQAIKRFNNESKARKIILDAFNGVRPSDFLGEEMIFLKAKALPSSYSKEDEYKRIASYGPAHSALTGERCLGLYFKNMNLETTIEYLLFKFFELSAYGRESN